MILLGQRKVHLYKDMYTSPIMEILRQSYLKVPHICDLVREDWLHESQKIHL